jgi:hypothetical protein
MNKMERGAESLSTSKDLHRPVDGARLTTVDFAAKRIFPHSHETVTKQRTLKQSRSGDWQSPSKTSAKAQI